MATVSIREAKNRLTELARQVENGATITVTRSGRPVFDIVPHRPRKGLRLEVIGEFKNEHQPGHRHSDRLQSGDADPQAQFYRLV